MNFDPISSMLVMMKNASLSGHFKVDIPISRMKLEIIRIIKDEGFIENYKVIEKSNFSFLRIYFKNEDKKVNIINNIKRISKSSRRIYKSRKDIPRLLNGLGLVIVSTSKGIMSGKKARDELKVGGEIICSIW